MTDNPPEAVILEAAARAAFESDKKNGHIKGPWLWEDLPEYGRENYRDQQRDVLRDVGAAFRSWLVAEWAAEVKASECEELARYLDKMAELRDGPLAAQLATSDRAHALTLRARAITHRSGGTGGEGR